jgi:hypothetical protein
MPEMCTAHVLRRCASSIANDACDHLQGQRGSVESSGVEQRKPARVTFHAPRVCRDYPESQSRPGMPEQLFVNAERVIVSELHRAYAHSCAYSDDRVPTVTYTYAGASAASRNSSGVRYGACLDTQGPKTRHRSIENHRRHLYLLYVIVASAV